MIAFAKRNLKLYLRDKGAVFFSLLAVFIVFGLYVLFLGDVYTADLGEIEGAEEIMNNWVMAGVLAITSMTTTLGMLQTVVKDKEDKIEKDFYASPVKRVKIAGGYVLSAYTVGFAMTLLAFLLAEIYIVAEGGEGIAASLLPALLLLIAFTVLMNTSISLFLVSLFKSVNAFTTANVIVGTLIGFLTGIYLPIGMLINAVQWIVKAFPVSHAALLFRNLMMQKPMEKAFEGAPKEVVLTVKENLGVLFLAGEKEMALWVSVFVMGATAVLFFTLASMRLAGKKR